MTDPNDSDDMIEPADRAEPMLKADPAEPTEPMLRADPVEATDSTEPVDPMLHNDPVPPAAADASVPISHSSREPVGSLSPSAPTCQSGMHAGRRRQAS
jgi:hypothetical protein